jgi:hypothetical protein
MLACVALPNLSKTLSGEPEADGKTGEKALPKSSAKTLECVLPVV